MSAYVGKVTYVRYVRFPGPSNSASQFVSISLMPTCTDIPNSRDANKQVRR